MAVSACHNILSPSITLQSFLLLLLMDKEQHYNVHFKTLAQFCTTYSKAEYSQQVIDFAAFRVLTDLYLCSSRQEAKTGDSKPTEVSL